ARVASAPLRYGARHVPGIVLRRLCQTGARRLDGVQMAHMRRPKLKIAEAMAAVLVFPLAYEFLIGLPFQLGLSTREHRVPLFLCITISVLTLAILACARSMGTRLIFLGISGAVTGSA